MRAEDFFGNDKFARGRSSETAWKFARSTVLEQDLKFYNTRVGISENSRVKLLLRYLVHELHVEEIPRAKVSKEQSRD